MRRTRFLTLSLGLFLSLLFSSVISAQMLELPDYGDEALRDSKTVEAINKYGTFDNWCIREVHESKIIGGNTRYLYEFYGDQDTTVIGKTPFSAPEGYLWRTNNVLAIVAGVVKTNNTVYPEPRNGGYCARIETHIEYLKALGIDLAVTCQGAILVGTLPEPITGISDPMSRVLYGIPFAGRPKALKFDYKAIAGCEVIRGKMMKSGLKPMGYPDYPQIEIVLQKRWEDEKGRIHALRVGTGIERIYESIPEWINGHELKIHYGDITGEPFYEDYMGLNNDPAYAYHAINSKGKNVVVEEDGWASEDEVPNFMIIKIISSCGEAFFGGVGNTVWIDNIQLVM